MELVVPELDANHDGLYSLPDPLFKDRIHFPDMRWLGACHNGYPHSTSLSAYVWIRLGTVTNRQKRLALWQSALSFGVLEIITGMRISENTLLSHRPDGEVVFSSEKVSILISHWLLRPPVTPMSASQTSEWAERTGEVLQHLEPDLVSPTGGGAEGEDSDDDVGPMPMPAGAENGGSKKKRKGEYLDCLYYLGFYMHN